MVHTPDDHSEDREPTGAKFPTTFALPPMEKIIENSFLDFSRQRGRRKFSGLENDIATLNVGLHLLETQPFQRLSKPVHFNSLVPAHVDSAKQQNINRHK